MRAFIVGALLVLGVAEPGLAQVVRCKLSVYHVGYGLGGSCVTGAANGAAEQTRTNRTRFWPKGAVTIFVAAGPGSPSPVPGLFYQSDWSDPFQIDLERIASGDGRLVIRTSGATLIVDEWKQLDRDAVSLVFHLNFAPATINDVAILQSVLTRFNAAKHWDRSGDQDCDDDAPGGVNLFCALQAAVKSQMGRYHHAQPAVDIVRALISEGFRDRYSGHILVDFNNHAKTTVVEVRTLFESAINRARVEVSGRK